jgi:magnesium chelatase family protein
VLDRIDLQVEVRMLTGEEFDQATPGEASAVVRERVLAARERQARRGSLNAALPTAAIRSACAPDAAFRALAREAIDRGGFSARAVTRALRVACTIADLAGHERVDETALAEALQYRAYEARRFGSST